MDSKLQQEREVNGGTPFAEARGSAYSPESAKTTIEEVYQWLNDGPMARANTGNVFRDAMANNRGIHTNS